jgi:catechol 2,3-dioxygenase-like lactoylglutathione lyase family enzyme
MDFLPRTRRTEGASGLSRRELLVALSAALAAPGASAQAPKASIATRRLNNVMIAVTDMTRSIAFYQKLFGAPAMQNGVAVFRVGEGPHFFSLKAAANGKPEYVSFGMTVEDFDPQRLMTTLSSLGAMGALVTPREGTPELFVPDPDGIRIQLQHVAYGYGSGPRGDGLALSSRGGPRPAFELRSLNHVTLAVTNGMRSQDFYQRVFGMPVQTRQGAGATLRIGAGPESVTVGGGNAAAAGINHACFSIENFDPNRAMGILIDNGLTPIEYGNPATIKPLTCRVRLRQQANNGGGPTSPLGTAELYFNDPDNMTVQIQDVTYCSGSGWLGQICP